MNILLFAFTLLRIRIRIYRGRAPTRRSPSQQGAPSLGGADDESENSEGGEAETPLGCVPHQLRGFLHSFRMHTLVAPAYSACTACSHAVQYFHFWMALHFPLPTYQYYHFRMYEYLLHF